MRVTTSLLAVILAGGLATYASADDSSLHDAVQQYMQEFKQDSAARMDQQLDKVDVSDEEGILKFSQDIVEENQFVDAKQEVKEDGICGQNQTDSCYEAVQQQEGRAGAYGNDQASRLVDGSGLTGNLDTIQAEGLLSARLERDNSQPWSDDYWAIAKGILGYRYAARPSYTSGDDMWKSLFDYTNGNPLTGFVSRDRTEQLSPSEKYDLVVGLNNINTNDRNRLARQLGLSRSEMPQGLFTPGQWSEGKRYYDSRGKVETWMGICHGWAAAAYTMPRAEKAIQVPRADNPRETVTFYPADIKALTSYLWAEVRTPTKFVGGRCNTKDPNKHESGRIYDQDCFDTNPATWHQSAVHQIAKQKRSFVLDATYDYEVWNQPVLGYEIAYFDPAGDDRWDTSTNWRDVARAKNDSQWVSKDKFRSFRKDQRGNSDYYTYVVGVMMEVEYLVETHPSTATVDTYRADASKSVRYVYDLEIDRYGNVVGGEWYSNLHPDFLWNIPQSVVTNRQYHTRADSGVSGSWNADTALPASWVRGAKQAALNRQPLGKIVDALIAKSRR